MPTRWWLGCIWEGCGTSPWVYTGLCGHMERGCWMDYNTHCITELSTGHKPRPKALSPKPKAKGQIPNAKTAKATCQQPKAKGQKTKGQRQKAKGQMLNATRAKAKGQRPLAKCCYKKGQRPQAKGQHAKGQRSKAQSPNETQPQSQKPVAQIPKPTNQEPRSQIPNPEPLSVWQCWCNSAWVIWFQNSTASWSNTDGVQRNHWISDVVCNKRPSSGVTIGSIVKGIADLWMKKSIVNQLKSVTCNGKKALAPCPEGLFFLTFKMVIHNFAQ